MRTFAQKQSQPQKPLSSSLVRPNMATLGLDREHAFHHVHWTIGNQAVLRMLQTHCEELDVGSTAAASPRFAHDFSRIPVYAPAVGAIQPKLAIDKAGDEYEQEADRMSEHVMRMPEPQLQRACPCGGGCPKCQRQNLAHEHERLQSQQAGSSDLGRVSVPPVVHDVLGAAGRPLDPATRSFMSPKFGADFRDVRVHTDARAAESARAVNALAYTVGRNVVFGANLYQPGTRDGQRLLAHELAHVVQQNQAPISVLQRARRSAAQCAGPIFGSAGQFGATVEAESEALAVASGGVTPPSGGPTSCARPRHGDRATNLETLATGAGLGATIAPGIAGFFINACLSPNDGAFNTSCSQFPGGPPAAAQLLLDLGSQESTRRALARRFNYYATRGRF